MKKINKLFSSTIFYDDDKKFLPNTRKSNYATVNFLLLHSYNDAWQLSIFVNIRHMRTSVKSILFIFVDIGTN